MTSTLKPVTFEILEDETEELVDDVSHLEKNSNRISKVINNIRRIPVSHDYCFIDRRR